MNDLPPIEYVLTPRDRDLAAWATVHLEHKRRAQNQRDTADDCRALERALEDV